MKSNLLYLVSLTVVLLFSCNKNDNDNPPGKTREWFKLKTILWNTLMNGNPSGSDSTSIDIDSSNNKIIFKEYTNSKAFVKTYTYNSDNQLVLFEHVKANIEPGLFISRMEFVRNSNGQLTKVLSQYNKNGVIESSEGSATYDKRGDTTFITYVDTANKRLDVVDQDFYQVAILNNKVVYHKNFRLLSIYRESSLEEYEYDAAENMIRLTYELGNSGGSTSFYQRGSEVPKELQKFMTQWAGDLIWFSRARFRFTDLIGNLRYYYAGNVVQSIGKLTITNGFDENGNLNKISYVTGSPPSPRPGTGYLTYTQQFKYRP